MIDQRRVDRTGQGEGGGLDDVDIVAGGGVGAVGSAGGEDAILIELQTRRGGNGEHAIVCGGKGVGRGPGIWTGAAEIEAGGVGGGEGDGTDVVGGDGGAVGVERGEDERDRSTLVDSGGNGDEAEGLDGGETSTGKRDGGGSSESTRGGRSGKDQIRAIEANDGGLEVDVVGADLAGDEGISGRNGRTRSKDGAASGGGEEEGIGADAGVRGGRRERQVRGDVSRTLNGEVFRVVGSV